MPTTPPRHGGIASRASKNLFYKKYATNKKRKKNKTGDDKDLW